jgi:hypothetical protein
MVLGAIAPSSSAAQPQGAQTASSQKQAMAKAAAISKLAATDRHVRSHEQAHLVVAGPYAKGGPSYTYAQGPDGNLYATGGEVSLDVSPVEGDPEATIQKARVIQQAANAPVDPSSQDRMVASAAASMELAAEQELSKRAQQVQRSYSPSGDITGQLFSLPM